MIPGANDESLFSFDDIFDGGTSPDSIADAIDEFTASLFSMPLPPLPTAIAPTPEKPQQLQVPNLSVPLITGNSIRGSSTTKASCPRKPSLPKSSFGDSREYRQAVAIPRYLEKRSRRTWNHGLMHPSRSAAAHRRPRNGGKFDAVSAKFVSSTELGSL
jgi:hypothetical protein